jgi:hypothetical protein
MAKTGRRLVAMRLITLGLAGTTSPVFGAEPEPPTMRIPGRALEPLMIEVVTVNQAWVPRETAKRAEEVATRIVSQKLTKDREDFLTMVLISRSISVYERISKARMVTPAAAKFGKSATAA